MQTKTFSMSGTLGWFLGSKRQNIWTRGHSENLPPMATGHKNLGLSPNILNLQDQTMPGRMGGLTLPHGVVNLRVFLKKKTVSVDILIVGPSPGDPMLL